MKRRKRKFPGAVLLRLVFDPMYVFKICIFRFIGTSGAMMILILHRDKAQAFNEGTIYDKGIRLQIYFLSCLCV